MGKICYWGGAWRYKVELVANEFARDDYCGIILNRYDICDSRMRKYYAFVNRRGHMGGGEYRRDLS